MSARVPREMLQEMRFRIEAQYLPREGLVIIFSAGASNLFCDQISDILFPVWFETPQPGVGSMMTASLKIVASSGGSGS